MILLIAILVACFPLALVILTLLPQFLMWRATRRARERDLDKLFSRLGRTVPYATRRSILQRILRRMK